MSIQRMWVGMMLQDSRLTQLQQQEAATSCKPCRVPPGFPAPKLPHAERRLQTELCAGLSKGPLPVFGGKGCKTNLKITETYKLTKRKIC